LLAYLIEKYSIGTFGFDFVDIKKGNLNPPFTKDELLTIVTYYWMTNTITPSIRYYRTNIEIPFKPWPRSEMRNYKVGNKVPVSIQYFKNEVWSYPFVLLQKTFLNLKQFKIESSGGHFAGFENPKKTADSFIDFVLSS
jgi:microsomal epoxide hydrolase